MERKLIRCSNENCKRVLYDVAGDDNTLPDVKECPHCGTSNIINAPAPIVAQVEAVKPANKKKSR